VLADFFGEWAKLEKVDHYKDIVKKKGPENMDAAFDLIRKHPTFWTDLPLLPHAMELIRFVKETFGEYYILSKPLERDPHCEAGKRAWVRMHLQDIPPERVLLTANKAQYARAGGDANILIDDYGVNIDHWREAGGIGIKYEPAHFAKVKKILKGLADDE
jgi:5'(3')-deoxyribonucleotidase